MSLRIPSSRIIKAFAVLCGLQFLFAAVAFALTGFGGQRIVHAVLGMGIGLYVFWIFIFGWVSHRFRDAFRRAFERVPLGWKTKFVLASTLLAMLEEGVTTAMTNTAPLYGLEVGDAHITASANYWDVVLGNSVIVFVPMFIAWALMLSRWKFSPNQALILFGLTGTVAEMGFGGPQHILEIGMWMFVYGLMVYLPAYSIPQDRPGREPKPWHWLLAVFLPFPFVALSGPLIAFIHNVRPSTLVKFPPMAP